MSRRSRRTWRRRWTRWRTFKTGAGKLTTLHKAFLSCGHYARFRLIYTITAFYSYGTKETEWEIEGDSLEEIAQHLKIAQPLLEAMQQAIHIPHLSSVHLVYPESSSSPTDGPAEGEQ